jgi:ElaB/YqjD/DUF883 family membrane-anchored ribosome-binding protein
MNTDDTSRKTQDIQEALQEKFTDLQESIQDLQKRVADASRKAAKATDRYVHENPWPVIGSVAAGCFVIGFILGRSRD